MSEMMKCFVMHGIGKIGLREKPVPRPGSNDAIIRTTAALICTSDSVEAGLPVIRGKKSISLERQVHIAAGLLVVTGSALG